MNWQKAKIGVIDFEGSVRTGIVEYGYVTIKKSKIINSETSCCNPSKKLMAEEEKSYRLKHAALSTHAHFSDKRELFMHLHRSVDVFCAHHSTIEENFFKMHWPYPTKRQFFKSASWGPWLDTRKIYENLYPSLGDFSLSHLVQTFNLDEKLRENASKYCPPERREPHCALYDALASALLINRFKDIPEVACTSLEWMLQASASGKKKRLELNQLSLF